MSTAKKIAEYIISYFSNIPTNPIEGDLTNLKLQKLLFYTAPVEEDPKMLIWDFCILTS